MRRQPRVGILAFEGITPLVMNNNAALLEGEQKGPDPAKYERDHFRDKCYRTATDRLFVPMRAIKKMLIVATKFSTKKPKGVAFKSFGPLIEAALIVNADAPLSTPIEAVQPWTAIVNLDPSKGPKGPRGPRTRPLIPLSWKTETTVTVMDDLLTPDVLSEIAELAGTRCGLLEARAIDYGRCYITYTEQPTAGA